MTFISFLISYHLQYFHFGHVSRGIGHFLLFGHNSHINFDSVVPHVFFSGLEIPLFLCQHEF